MSIFTKFLNLFRGPTYYIGSNGARSRSWAGPLDQNEIVSAILDCNATHTAKGQVVHVLKDSEGRTAEIYRESAYTKLFSRPNPMMTRQDFLYAMAWNLQVANTAFAWVKWDAKMQPIEVWPLVYTDFEIRQTTGGEYAVVISDSEGRYTVLMEDLVILRRKYDGKGYAAQGNAPVQESVGMVADLDASLKDAVSISNKIHGLLKQKNAMLATESADVIQQKFVERMKAAAKEGGIVTLDTTEDYTPLSVNTWSANAAQMKAISDRVYTYWRTPQEVVSNTASEQVMQNYYDSVVEPIWEEMGEAFTRALFTQEEIDAGNRVILYSVDATGASWATKLSIINNTKDIGMLSRNEQRELLGYGPVEDGDEHYVSLNYIKSSDISKYQTGEDGDGND